MPVPLAYLRVFEPLAAFPEAERLRWTAYLDREAGLGRRTAIALEQRVAQTRLLTGRAGSRDAALVRRVNDQSYLCPLDLELRTAVALLTFRQALPLEAIDAFVEPAAAARAVDEIAAAERAPHIRESAWAVPLEWFLLFEPEERRFHDHPAGARITYLTRLASASDRMEAVIELVEAVIEDGEELSAVLEGLADWLGHFDPASVIELDYAEVARLVPPGLLEEDRTCSDLWQAVAHLEEDDFLGATAYYAAARARWSEFEARSATS